MYCLVLFHQTVSLLRYVVIDKAAVNPNFFNLFIALPYRYIYNLGSSVYAILDPNLRGASPLVKWRFILMIQICNATSTFFYR